MSLILAYLICSFRLFIQNGTYLRRYSLPNEDNIDNKIIMSSVRERSSKVFIVSRAHLTLRYKSPLAHLL